MAESGGQFVTGGGVRKKQRWFVDSSTTQIQVNGCAKVII